MTRPQRSTFPGSRAIVLAFLATGVGVSLPHAAHAASKATVAAIGDPAPGDPTGVFAGPGFAGWPAAAGDGWVAFRGEIAAGETSEEIVVAHMTVDPPARALVAAVGKPAPGGGTFKELRRRVVNAHGDVAFLALLNLPGGTPSDPTAPTAAGIFLYRNGTLSLVARSGQETRDGLLDLVGTVDPSDDPEAADVTDRAPALDDAGDVAFVSAFAGGAFADGAIFLAPAAGGLVEKVHTGAGIEGGQLVNLGAPALNNAGEIAFRARVELGKGSFDGIFAVGAGGLTTLVRGGMLHPMPLDQTLAEFGDEVSLNDAGDVAFLGGPLVDPSPDAESSDPVLGVVVCHGGVPHLAGYPGAKILGHTMTGFTLGAKGGNQTVPPALAPDGSVVFFATLDNGNSEAILRWTLADAVTLVVYTAGAPAGAAPGGGTYFGMESAPAVDAVGGVAFFVRVLDGPASDAVVYQSPSGPALAILVGDAAPRAGFFAGQPFATPRLNDRGDVVFHAFVALGQSSAGIYRLRDGVLAPIVRAGDPSPLAGGPPFQEFSTLPRLDAGGRVVFSAIVAGKGRGIYLADVDGIHPVVVRGDPGPVDAKFTFRAIAPDPDIDDTGRIAFAGSTAFKDPVTHVTTRRDGVFVADGGGVHAIAYAGDAAGDPGGHKLVRFSDAVLAAGGVVVRARLDGTPAIDGLFFANGPGTTVPIAFSQQDLGNNVSLTGFSGRAASADGTDVAFLASRALSASGKTQNLGQAILRHTTGGLGLVVAKDMPGPAGGTFRNFGEPNMNAAGHVVFRGSFERASGGTPGLFLATETGIAPYALIGEATPLGGRFAAFRKNAALDGHDEVAFVASVGGGRARQGLFLSTPTVFEARALVLTLRRRPSRDQARFALHLELGRVSDGADARNEPVTLTLADTRGPVWSTTLPAGTLRRRGRVFSLPPSRHDALRRRLRHLRIVARRHDAFDVKLTAVALDLTQKRSRPLRPPFTVSLEIGDDSGTVGVPCIIRKHGGRCAGR